MACSASREFSNRGEFRDRPVLQSRISFGCCRERGSGGRRTLECLALDGCTRTATNREDGLRRDDQR